VGCGHSAPKAELARFVLRLGVVEPDPDATQIGRGAYLHRDPECAAAAVRRRGFERSFRAPVAIPDDLLESVG
jgi:predicted RNA-binding protein YlxR (DUF448 family)